MPNHVDNTISIICEDDNIMKKIRKMIFDTDENNNRIYTMSKMLPRPEGFSDKKGYNDYGYDWSIAIWGTKGDVYNCRITESGNTINICYQTAWSPNVHWVKFLCHYIQETLKDFDKERPFISVKLTYIEFMGDFGGIFDWVPFKNPINKSYPLIEYARIHDKKLYESVSEYKELRKSVGETGGYHLDDSTDEIMDEKYGKLPF